MSRRLASDLVAPFGMPITRAIVRDRQSAEYLKSIALAEEDRAASLPLWKSAHALDPENATLVSHLALALLDCDRSEEVVSLLKTAFIAHPRLSHLVNVYGAALSHLGFYREAKEVFEHCLSLDPDYPNAAENLKAVSSAVHAQQTKAPAALKAAIRKGIELGREKTRPTLAVCMIVKDEEEFIEGALQSVSDVADELIVVDTGSSDRTVELAKNAGATVHLFPWTGDFAEARNESLKGATTDWILVLDADERLKASSRSSLRAAIEEHAATDALAVICVRIRNYTKAGRYMSDGFSGRLFKNHPVLQFEGRVHEEVARGNPEVASDYRLDIEFDHYGADPDVMASKAKDARNIGLLETRVAESPDDLMTWYYLASQHWLARRADDAITAFRRVIELFERNPSQYGMAVRNVPVPYSYVGLGRALILAGEWEQASAILGRGLNIFPQNPDLWFQAGFAQLAQGDDASAKQMFMASKNIKVGGYGLIGMHDPSIGAWRAAKMLGDIDFANGDQDSAFLHYADAYEKMPDQHDEKYIVAARMVELSAAKEEFDSLIRFTVDYVRLKPDAAGIIIEVAAQLASVRGPEPAFLLLEAAKAALPAVVRTPEIAMAWGQLCEQAGQTEQAVEQFLIVAEAGHDDPRFWVHLAQLCLGIGREDVAAEAFAVAKATLAKLQGE